MSEKFAIAKIGPWKGQRVSIKRVEFGMGSRSGWYTVVLPNNETGLFTGDELDLIDGNK